MKSVCIVLTACINPNGKGYTKLQDADIRRKQYEEALAFYLNSTDLPIVFVENTMTDISHSFKRYIDSGRLEYICFDGNNYNNDWGKGYGEAKILIYGIENSRIIAQSQYVIKITGRVIVRNIKRISESFTFGFNRLFRCNLASETMMSTVVFIGEPRKIKEMCESILDKLAYSEDHQIEYHLHQAIVEDKTLALIPFTYSPILDGISGTYNGKYTYRCNRDNLLDNLFFWTIILKRQGKVLRSLSVKCLYYISVVISRLSSL